MGGFFGVASKTDCVGELFYGIDYHSHLGTRRGGMATHGPHGFDRAIHNIQNSPFRTKFDHDLDELEGTVGIGCISDYEPQPLLVRSNLGTYAISTVGIINNADTLMCSEKTLYILTRYEHSHQKKASTLSVLFSTKSVLRRNKSAKADEITS